MKLGRCFDVALSHTLMIEISANFSSCTTVCEQAYTLAQNLDPSSEGRGMLQFKTGLQSVIKVCFVHIFQTLITFVYVKSIFCWIVPNFLSLILAFCSKNLLRRMGLLLTGKMTFKFYGIFIWITRVDAVLMICNVNRRDWGSQEHSVQSMATRY